MSQAQGQTVFIPNTTLVLLFKVILFLGGITFMGLCLGLIVLLAQLIVKAYEVLSMFGHGLYALYASRDGFEQTLVLAVVLFALYLLVPRITRIVDRFMPYLSGVLLVSMLQTEQA